ncbi:MAG: hypothetical protein GY757_17585, partial [bacterium]|nr:hypothetical protein [bacterium]
MKANNYLDGLQSHGPLNKSQPLTLVRLDKELILRESINHVPGYFNPPDTLSRKHGVTEIIKGMEKIYLEAVSGRPDPMLSRFSTPDLVKIMRKKARDLNRDKGIRFH